jgi:hypothetical protein
MKTASRKATALLAVLLAGCSTTGNQVYQCCVGQTLKGDENLVSVSNVWSAGDALPLAAKHCRAYNKDAVFDRMSFITAHFKCESSAK